MMIRMIRFRPMGRGEERGSASVELAYWAPFLLLLLGILIVGARSVLADYRVQDAAFAAAREASISRTVGEATEAGNRGAYRALAESGVRCSAQKVVLDTSAFQKPIGTVGQVTATLTCTVKLSDIGVPGWPGSKNITRSATSPVDPYRQR